MAPNDTEIPGVRPDKATVYCGNCGCEFDPRGNPCNVAPNQRVPVDCPECPVRGVIFHNRFSYMDRYTGDIEIEAEGQVI